MRGSLGALLGLALATSGCISPLTALTTQRPLSVGSDQFFLRSGAGSDGDAVRVSEALEDAALPLARWGGLTAPVTVYVLPNHEALERAVRRPGFDWLRAWARYDDILLQAPSTWAPDREALAQLLTHELTHCLMFQHSAGPDDWTERRIPLWFREGMAIWTAGQRAAYPTLEDTAAWLQEHRDLDVFGDAEALSQTYARPVYGVAAHAFDFLVSRYGVATVKATLADMKGGHRFAEAFAATVGLSERQFQDDFRTYVRLKGFRGWARPVGRPVIRLDQVLRRPEPPPPDE